MLETAVIGGMLLHEGPPPPEVLGVEPHYFQDKRHTDIWAAIQDLLAERDEVDEVSVNKKLKDWGINDLAVYVMELAADTPTSANLGHWSKLLSEDGRQRDTKQEIAQVLKDGGSADEISARVGEITRRAKESSNQAGLVHISEPLKKLVKELEHEYQNPNEAALVKSGIGALDKMCVMKAGELTIIAGRPGMGKTSLAGNIAQHCAKDITRGAVCLFSLEMSDTQLIRRMVAAAAGLDSETLARRVADERLMNAMNKVHQLDLYVDDRSSIGPIEIRQALMRIKKVRLVVVDYIQLARLDDRIERHDLRIGAVTKGLKAISKDFGCHVIALSQLNRGAEKNDEARPKMANLRDSGNIEEDADRVLFLYRPHVYNPQADPNDAEIIIGKQRGGRTGSVDCHWHAARQQFYGRAE